MIYRDRVIPPGVSVSSSRFDWMTVPTGKLIWSAIACIWVDTPACGDTAVPDVVVPAEDHAALGVAGRADLAQLRLAAGALEAAAVPVGVHGVQEEAVGDLPPAPGAPLPRQGARPHGRGLPAAPGVHHGAWAREREREREMYIEGIRQSDLQRVHLLKERRQYITVVRIEQVSSIHNCKTNRTSFRIARLPAQ